MDDPWAEDEVTTRYVPRRRLHCVVEVDRLLLLEQRVAALERSSLRIFGYLRRAFAERNAAADERRRLRRSA